ncbi:MFS transporter [Cnuibacter physcomitrellae]|uniref:MFS transporter n=1 Tax=Cnuibacter physcomitrellae TaxID=1619308 RepID=A0A1X9LNS4_9MICO|nr:MFS transporter [Cnuibacter physcomitrellae]ARJ05611.1 MFS transporter [Cnuibacter physcomitrellae]GGI36080.1 MFS transporter [Cnuibacter physcomitrellae]
MTGTTAAGPRRRTTALGVTAGLIGYLFFVELTSGIIQGYYVPLIPDLVDHLGIHDADFNWFEAAQLLLSAIVVPVLAKLGDMVGHKRILLISSIVTAAATWWLAFAGDFTSFLVAWALQGFYVVWLPLEVALIFDRGRRTGHGPSQTRRAAGLLVVALETGAIVGALAGGRLFSAFGGDVTLTLMLPAVATTLVIVAILFGVPESEPVRGRSLDTGGFVLLTLALLLVTSGLTFLRLEGPGAWWVWLVIAVGIAAFYPFGRYELRHRDPAIDLRMLARPTMWPVQLTAGLVGISILGAQAPLSTYAGTDPANGYGLGLDSSDISTLIGAYLIAMIVGALLFPVLSRRASPRVAMIVGTFLVAIGYCLWLPFHDEVWQGFTNMVIAGLGSGALVGALPAAAAAAAPVGQTGIAAGMTNTTKTIGGSFASAVFAVVLFQGAATAVDATASSLSGYLVVWAVCGGTALVAAVLLFFVPKLAFADPEAETLVAAAPTGRPAA